MSVQRHASLAIHTDPASSGPHRVRRLHALSRFRFVALLLVVLMLVGAAAVLFGRRSNMEALAATSRQQLEQHVLTVRPVADNGDMTLSLPGTLEGEMTSPISARTAGYLVRWTKDIGSPVRKGDLLAEISSPEADQQLAQAVAAREQIASTVEISRVSFDRWQNLHRENAVSKQEFDERRSAYEQAKANLAAADANVRRLRELQSFKRIVAPFSGVITRRNVEVGDLIDPGSNRPLFLLTQTEALRLYVQVPQAYAGQIRVGQTAKIRQAEMSGQAFEGKIVRTAGAIDASNRSMQVEISVPNREKRLLPGAYVDVTLPVGASDVLTLPTNTLLIRVEGPRVAVVDKEGRIRLHPVVIGKDFGQKLQILSGISAKDDIVLNPSDSLEDNDRVVVSAAAPATSATANRR